MDFKTIKRIKIFPLVAVTAKLWDPGAKTRSKSPLKMQNPL